MSIIKETIRNNGQDVNLKFSLDISNRLSGYQQEIDNLTEETKEELINPVIDYEIERFKYLSGTLSTITFWFSTGSTHDDTFIYAGFTSTEIEQNDNVLNNSFFIVDFYNTYDNNIQTKLFTTYITKILNGETSSGVPVPKYSLNGTIKNQFYYQYVPKWFLDTQTGETITVYVRFSFYNAKDGTISLFYNSNNTPLTPNRMYFKAYLYPETMEWNFDLQNPQPYELSPNNTYVTKVNDTFENFENLQQNPQKGAFNPEDGTYDEPELSSNSTTTTTTTIPSSGGGDDDGGDLIIDDDLPIDDDAPIDTESPADAFV